MTNHERRIIGEFLTNASALLASYSQTIEYLDRALGIGAPLSDEDRAVLADAIPGWRTTLALSREGVTGVRAQLGIV